jgi:hypothetical protein
MNAKKRNVATDMTNTEMKTATRFLAEAWEGAGLRQAATIMPPMAGANTPGIITKEVGPSSTCPKMVNQEIANAKMKNHTTGCFLMVKTALLLDSTVPFGKLATAAYPSHLALSSKQTHHVNKIL